MKFLVIFAFFLVASIAAAPQNVPGLPDPSSLVASATGAAEDPTKSIGDAAGALGGASDGASGVANEATSALEDPPSAIGDAATDPTGAVPSSLNGGAANGAIGAAVGPPNPEQIQQMIKDILSSIPGKIQFYQVTTQN